MSLAARCAYAFSDPSAEAGEGYFRSGRVALRAVDEGGASADVDGTRSAPYRVALEWPSDGLKRELGVACTCPHFADGFYCKHIFATLLAVDGSAPERVREGTRILKVEPIELEHSSAVDVDAAGSEGADSGSGRRRERASRWRTRLRAIEAAAATPADDGAAEGVLAGRLRSVWYAIDLEASRERARLTLAFLQRDRKRSGALGKTRPVAVSEAEIDELPDPEDRALLGALLSTTPEESHAGGYASSAERSFARSRVGPALYDNLLPRLAATGRLGWVRSADTDPELRPLTWDGGSPWRFELELHEDASTERWRLDGWLVRDGDEPVSIHQPLLMLSDGLLVFEDRVGRLARSPSFAWIFQIRHGGPVTVPGTEIDAFLSGLWEMEHLPPVVLPERLGWTTRRVAPRPRLTLRAPTDRSGPAPLGGEIRFRYGAEEVARSSTRSALVDRVARRVVFRDPAAEHALLAELPALGFRPPTEGGDERADVALSRRDFLSAVGALVTTGWVVEAEGQRVRPAGPWRMSVSSGVDWFDLTGSAEFDGQTVPLDVLLGAIRRGERFVRLGDGSRGMLPEEWLERYAPIAGMGQMEGDHLRFARSQASLLDVLLASQPEVDVDATFARIREELARFRSIEPVPRPEGFQGELRDYQRDGLGWLVFLERLGFGGCLADDMGLGKTIQVLALLERRRVAHAEGTREGVRPSLVVAPRSLIFNWTDEAHRFTPGLEVLNYTGLGRARDLERIGEHDVVVTTYGTLRRDIERLSAIRFDYAILDEAQAIKNASSQSAKACRLIQADHRLALSGTPVENHLGELWSIFEFLNPGFVGSLPGVRKLATQGPEGDGSLGLVARALRPFILRRTKEQVLTELPPKTEQTLYCELSPKQQHFYRELRDRFRASLKVQIEKHGFARSKIHVLEALLRLRQAACHPGLVEAERVDEPSAKLETLRDQIEEVIGGGHKALVFSQFTSLLKLVRRQLDDDGIGYEYLDGRTRKRDERVRRFQEDGTCPVFLISLKAGGQGLNLTAADYVFILDPWWNPAVEAQAVDRTHRIGQNRRVFAYRLIARGTVEEKILELQRDKRKLADAIVEANRKRIADLTADDLKLLLG